MDFSHRLVNLHFSRSIMNLFGVLKYKKMGEEFLQNSGFPYTIIKPGRLTDGPYTSYDLNTLLKATAGQRRAVLIGQGDKLVGEASRIVVAEACVQALDLEVTENQIYEVNSVEGEGPGNDAQKWQELFEAARSS
ncbi:NAD-dependent epimerase/dehydratase family protein [Medicago truncatula]|uniref:NAD-dependent epimerase/dehydratase family protein n=2 Tax=Medicago truncatula TaxID=3880 RepID=A0A072TX08_MEDTR|nr:NAD-dependent epimerase/dehydratase family protein [Medicago truncatula]